VSIGILNETSYAIIVLIAVLTTIMTARLLKVGVRRLDHSTFGETGPPQLLQPIALDPDHPAL
jgi:hypothetical protein